MMAQSSTGKAGDTPGSGVSTAAQLMAPHAAPAQYHCVFTAVTWRPALWSRAAPHHIQRQHRCMMTWLSVRHKCGSSRSRMRNFFFILSYLTKQVWENITKIFSSEKRNLVDTIMVFSTFQRLSLYWKIWLPWFIPPQVQCDVYDPLKIIIKDKKTIKCHKFRLSQYTFKSRKPVFREISELIRPRKDQT